MLADGPGKQQSANLFFRGRPFANHLKVSRREAMYVARLNQYAAADLFVLEAYRS
jgi:hypothetical protein